jgi:hypothetical protein
MADEVGAKDGVEVGEAGDKVRFMARSWLVLKNSLKSSRLL